MIRARCDVELKRSIEQIAAIQQLDAADIIRIACAAYVLKFRQPIQDLRGQRREFSSDVEMPSAGRMV